MNRKTIEKKFDKLGLYFRPATAMERAERGVRWAAGNPGVEAHRFFTNLIDANVWVEYKFDNPYWRKW